MKRKSLVLFIVTTFIYACFQIFSGCAKKAEVALGPSTTEIAAQKATEVEAAAKAAEEARARAEYYRIAAEESEEEFTLEEIAVTGQRRTRPVTAKKAGLKKESYMPRVVTGKSKIKISFEIEGLGTELWIIEKSSSAIGKEYRTESPRLMCSLPGKEDVILPLESTSVDAGISGYIATVNVLQKYHNPYSDKIEAVYVFPLPQNAAVTDFVMIVGDRKIRGIIREKEEAQRIYQQAKSQGYRASLLIQERPNIFKQRVANIEPGKRIDISITFFNTLKYENGEFEFVFPTVVGPRYNPAGQSDGIGAVGRDTHSGSGQSTDVRYLRPNETTAHNIAINVDIDAGVSIEKVYSRSHVINVDKKSPSHAVVTLSPNDRIPNKDFMVRYKTSGREVKTAMMVHKGDKGNYFTLMLQPPEDLKNLPRIPREMVFVLDCSGSMSGRPLNKAKEAVRRALRNLNADDTFQMIRFSSNASALGPNPVPATPDNVKKGLEYLESLNSYGGTEMIEGIKAALDFPHDKSRLRIISFMTDGYIGNEYQILAAIHERLGASRIFSFGVGNSVNRYLLERMAVMGRGAVAYVGLDESAGEAVDRFYDVATRPAMANIDIDWGNLKVDDVYPKRIPDLFVGRPVMITGRLKNNASGRIRIKGQAGEERLHFDMNVNPDSSEAKHQGIRSVWARCRLAELSNLETYNPGNKVKIPPPEAVA
jgi:Ca-activated chloride channel family protein